LSTEYSQLHGIARRFAQAGVPVFPCLPGTKTPRPDPTLPKGEGGFKVATADLAQIDAWWAEEPEYNVAYRPCDLPEPCVVLDLDLYKSGGISEPIRAILPPTRTVGTPSGGEHRYYKTDQKFDNGAFAPNVDVRSANGYVLAPGSVINGVEYRVIDSRPYTPLPERIAAALGERKEKTGKGRALPHDVEEVDEHPELAAAGDKILTGIDLTGATATGDRAWKVANLLLDLCTPHGKVLSVEGAQALAPWIAESVFENAIKYGDDERGKRIPHPDPDGRADDFDKVMAAKRPAATRTYSEGLTLAPLVYLDHGQLLPERALVIAYGPPGSHKTGLALALAVECIQRGHRVLYCASEGSHGIETKRMPALVQHTKIDSAIMDDRWAIRPGAFVLTADVKDLVADIVGWAPKLLVLDVASLYMSGDWNTPEVATAFMAACRRVTEMGATVLLICHPGKDEARGVIGSRQFENLADAIHLVEKREDQISITVKKMKDGEDGRIVARALHSGIGGVPVVGGVEKRRHTERATSDEKIVVALGLAKAENFSCGLTDDELAAEMIGPQRDDEDAGEYATRTARLSAALKKRHDKTFFGEKRTEGGGKQLYWKWHYGPKIPKADP
jgi:hypothetical protein